MGRPGTAVIPPNWSRAPRVVFEKTRTGACAIRHPGADKVGPLDTTTGTYPMTEHGPHFTGSVRVQALSTQEQQHLTAEDPVTTVGYRLCVSVTADQVEVEDVVTVTCFDDNGDPLLLDRELIVRALAVGTLAWERYLICSDDLG